MTMQAPKESNQRLIRRFTFLAVLLGLSTSLLSLPGYAEGYGGNDFDLSSNGYDGAAASQLTAGAGGSFSSGTGGYAPKLMTDTAVLAPGSVDQSGFPSGSFSYGFGGGATGPVIGVPMTSTGSVDINTVSF